MVISRTTATALKDYSPQPPSDFDVAMVPTLGRGEAHKCMDTLISGKFSPIDVIYLESHSLLPVRM